MLSFEHARHLVPTESQLVNRPGALVETFRHHVVEFFVQFKIGVESAGGQVQVAVMLLEELLIFFVGDCPSDLPADIVESPFLGVENGEDFFLEHLELAQLVQPLVASLLETEFKLDSLLHEFVHFLVEEGEVYQLALACEVAAGAVGADEHVLFAEALLTGADATGLQVMPLALGSREGFHGVLEV